MTGALAGVAGAASGVGATARATMSRDQFLKILVTELTSQNPLEPLDNNEFVQQLVGLQTMEQTAALTDSLRGFESFLQMSSAGSLIGKVVKGQAADGQPVVGTVSRVLMEGGQVSVMVGATRLPVSSVTEIRSE
jgi:flagellar basal-body rod modification protein FlgD